MRRIVHQRTLWLAVVCLALAFLFIGANLDFDYVIPKRLSRLAAIAIGGVCVAVSSLVFQTVAGNRILTPAVMGYEAVYLLLQSLLVLVMGMHSVVLLGQVGNFAVSIALMLAYSWAIHYWLFRDS